MIKLALNILKYSIPRLSNKTISKLRKKYKGREESLPIDLILTACETLTKITYIYKEQNIVRLNEKLIENARITSLGFFIIDICRDVKLNWHHIEWIQMAEDYNSMTTINASRGLGKTFFWGEVWFTWLIYRHDPSSTNPVLRYNKAEIFSMSQSKAQDKLSDIIKRIESNPILSAKVRGFKTKNAKKIITELGFEIDAYGFNTGSRGGHVPYILLDDILTDNAIYSGDYRTKSYNNLSANILPQLNAGGKLVLIGTPMHNEDCYGKIKAIVKGITNEKFEYKFTFREYPAILPDGRLCWAWQRPRAFLDAQRLIQGELIFAQEYLCRPVSEGSSIFPYKYLVRARNVELEYICSIEEFPYWDNVVFVASGSDFALSATASADFMCNSVIACTTWKKLYLMFINREKGVPYSEQMGKLRNVEVNFQPNIMAVENNNFQKIYEEQYRDQYVFSNIKGYTTTTNKNNYMLGLPALASLFERGILQFPYKTESDKKLTDLAFSEFNSIAFTDKGLKSTQGHDDIVFSIWKAYQACLDLMDVTGFKIFNF